MKERLVQQGQKKKERKRVNAERELQEVELAVK